MILLPSCSYIKVYNNDDANKIVRMVAEWLTSNPLLIDIMKTYAILFANLLNLSPPRVIVNNSDLKLVESFELFSCVIDNKLC